MLTPGQVVNPFMFYVENPLDKLKGLHTVRRLKFLGRGIVCFINVSKANDATCYDISVILD